VYVPSHVHPVAVQRAIISDAGLKVSDIRQISAETLPPPLSPKLCKAGAPFPQVVTGYVVAR
jgi:hypothetical protein